MHAIGRMKAGPEKQLADHYFERFAKSGDALGFNFNGVSELVESRASPASARQSDEALRVKLQIAPGTAVVLLDERGENLSSDKFAERLASFRDGGKKALAIVVGGPDGHAADFRASADLLLSFGALTWPHQMARIMLAEQLYRAATILSGHPYHRS